MPRRVQVPLCPPHSAPERRQVALYSPSLVGRLRAAIPFLWRAPVSYTHLDVLTYAQFGQVAVKFFENRRNKQLHIDGEHVDTQNKVHPL